MILGGCMNTVSSSYSVAFGSNNTICTGSLLSNILGGCHNCIDAYSSSIIGGYCNCITLSYGAGV